MDTSAVQNFRNPGRSYTKNAKVRKRKKNATMNIDIRKVAVIAAATVLVVVAGYVVYNRLPFVKVSKAIGAGNQYRQEADYEAAIDSYTKAIQIDSHSVTAYSNLAGAYLSLDDSESAKKTLYDGWQNTGNAGLLNNYHTVILNESVATINAGAADMATAQDILSVLRDNSSNADAIALLDAAYDRIFEDAYSYNTDALFRSNSVTYAAEGGSSTFSYEDYCVFVNDLLEIYSAAPSEELKAVVLKYAVPGVSSFTMNYENAIGYLAILDRVEQAVGTNDEITSFRACITNAQEVQAIFADIFQQLDVGNVDELRDFVVSEQYLNLRNIFLNKVETPQENTTYVAISREAIILNNNDGKWSYRFLNFEENPATSGVITLWANYFEDGGIQRNSISYEPKSVDGNYYPHTKYSVTYLNSYVTSGKSTKVAKMNYRLETSIITEDGEETETVVSDWGGSDESTMDIDTIESRIRA